MHDEARLIDDTIELFVKGKKMPYKEFHYQDSYEPPVYQDPTPELRCSDRLAKQTEQWIDCPKTTWTSAKSKEAGKVNGKSFIVPSCLQAVPNHSMIDQPLTINYLGPFKTDSKSERLRVCHARLSLLQAMLHPEQADHKWQVETITDWTTTINRIEQQILLKVTWIGGEKQQVSVDNMRLHGLYQLIKDAIKYKLTDKPGFE